MFSHVSVCPQGGLGLCRGGGSLSEVVSVWGGSLSRGSLCPGRLYPGGGSLSGGGLCPRWSLSTVGSLSREVSV